MAKAELDGSRSADRDRKKPEVLRHALEGRGPGLLVQEALAAASRRLPRVDWAYDQMRREHPRKGWEEFLRGRHAEDLRTELRTQQTVAASSNRNTRARRRGARRRTAPAPGGAEAALLARLRAKARIELLL